MSTMTPINCNNSIIFYTKKDAFVWVPSMLACTLVAFFLVNNYSLNFKNILEYPIIYSGDFWLYSILIEALGKNTWIFAVDGLGYPFGFDFRDFPSSDNASLLILKLLRIICGNYYATYNIFFLFGFPLAFVASYLVSRTFGINRIFSITLGIVFTFLPYHFTRTQHLFLTYYFVVPLYIYYAYLMFTYGSIKNICKGSRFHYIVFFVGLFFLASFGVYYALFGAMTIFTASLVVAIKNRIFSPMIWGGIIVIVLGLSIIINISPSLYNDIVNGKNDITQRSLHNTEVAGLKISQMLLPTPNSKIPAFSEISKKYYQNITMGSEGWNSANGFTATIGFCIILLAILYGITGQPLSNQLSFVSISSIFLVFFTTMGGFSSFFALFVSTAIRGWNRINIFIAFFSLIALMIIISHFIKFIENKTNKLKRIHILAISSGIALAVSVFAILDQHIAIGFGAQDMELFENDKKLYTQIESSLPQGAAIYQLPYMQFPEVPPQHQLPDYYLGTGFLNSNQLKWSYGGTKRRDGSSFYFYLNMLPIVEQIKILKKMGFSGISIARHGYADNGIAVEKEIAEVLGHGPDIISQNNRIAFYRIIPEKAAYNNILTPKDIGHEIHFYADNLGKRSLESNDSFHINFGDEFLSSNISDLKGMSGREPWGRWSNVNAYKHIEIIYNKPLPKNFSFEFKGHSSANNISKPIIIQIGDIKKTFILNNGTNVIKIPFKINGETNKIIIAPPYYTIPRDVNQESRDTRKLGIGINSIDIIEETK